jgi:SAM-dependent methyltransferase
MARWVPRFLRQRKSHVAPVSRGVDWNRSTWGSQYDWSRRGEEWSDPWGSSEAQWYASLLPRLRSFLPAGTVLEIAPGYGRWTRFLIPLSEKYYGVDLAPTAVAHCQKRFAASSAEFFVNDGRCLDMIADGCIGLCFSFDSLVHAEIDVVDGYIQQILRKLSPSGVAFLHHSNCGEHKPKEGRRHCRAESVSAGAVRASVDAGGGHVLRHEIITWRGVEAMDGLVLFARRGAFNVESSVVYNPDFTAEADNIRERIAPWSFQRDSDPPLPER